MHSARGRGTHQINVFQNGVDRDICEIVADNWSRVSVVESQQIPSQLVYPRIARFPIVGCKPQTRAISPRD